MMTKTKKYQGLKSLGSTLSNITKPILGKRGFVETDIITRWQEIVGKDLAGVVVPQKIVFARGQRDNGVLHVLTKGGGEALLLQHKERLIIDKINSFFGYRAIQKITITQGFFDNKDEVNNCKKYDENEEDDDITRERVAKITKNIKNENLANALARLTKSFIKDNKGEGD